MKTPSRALGLVGGLVLALSGCRDGSEPPTASKPTADPGDQPVQPMDEPAPPPPPQPAGPIDPASSDPLAERGSFLATYQARLDAIDRKIGHLERRIAAMTDRPTSQMQAQLRELEDQRQRAGTALDEAYGASQELWTEARDRARKLIAELETSYGAIEQAIRGNE